MATLTHSKGKVRLCERLEKRRRETRRKQKQKAESRKLIVSGFNDDEKLMAEDERGKQVSLKVRRFWEGSGRPDPERAEEWRYRIGFSREQTEDLAQDQRKGDRIPKRIFWIETDIYHGVRAIKHTMDSHREELRDNDRLFSIVHPLHGFLAETGARLQDDEILKIAAQLIEIDQEASKKRSGCKILAQWKLDDVPGKLQEAVSNRSLRGLNIGAACALLVPFEELYGPWREDQIFNIDVYNKARFELLRALRDKRIGVLLSELADNLRDRNKGIGFALTAYSDWLVIRALREAQDKIKAGLFGEACGLVRECESRSKQEWLLRRLQTMRIKLESHSESRPAGWRERIRKEMEEFARKLGRRNPIYILKEIHATGDAYMKKPVGDGSKPLSVIGEMKQACIDIENAYRHDYFPSRIRLIRSAASHLRSAMCKLAVEKPKPQTVYQARPQEGPGRS